MKNLVLICGGVSPEHEISIRSARNILQALDDKKYQIHLIGISKSGSWYLIDKQNLDDEIPEGGNQISLVPGNRDCLQTSEGSIGDVDVVFPILHGPNGEDGSVQGLLQLLNVPFVGPSVLGSSISMDKDVAKQLLKHNGIQVANWISLKKGDIQPEFSEVVDQLGDVVFVKPANMGSSVGVSRVTNSEELNQAIEDAFLHDKKVLIEECLKGRELECAVIGNESPRASGVGEVISGEVYTYDEKYAENSTAQVIIPANVSKSELLLLQEAALNSYKALECEGLARVDMFLTDSGQIIVNEVNTMPGFTSISMYPQLWVQEGMSYTELLDELIDYGVNR